RLLITEVKNDHTLIKLDAAHSFDQAHTMHYESTHQGQDDQKEDAKKTRQSINEEVKQMHSLMYTFIFYF
ncbi:hypothetical protein LHK59_13390, partial [Staphylococcus argenteus]|nr:hypothetical protein [Staphylococcus argenteus]